MAHREGPSESVNDFATDLRKLFVESYLNKEITLAISRISVCLFWIAYPQDLLVINLTPG